MINPWIFAAMVPAMVVLMLQLAIGPFGHMKFIHWHLRFRKISPRIRIPLLLAAALTLTAGTAHLLGWWQPV